MALTMTLADSLKLTKDTLQAGVIETLATESKLLAVLPFMNIVGSGYTYNVETQLSDTQFRAVGEAIDPGQTSWETRTEALKIMGDEAVIDTFQQQVYGNVTDLMALEVGLKAKAIAHKYEKTFIAGDSKSNVKEFDGIDKRIIEGQTVTADELTAEAIDEAIDRILGTPDAIVMNKSARRAFTSKYRDYITYSRNEFGVQLAQYGGVNIIDLEDELLTDNGTAYVLRFGAKEAVCGLTNGGVQVKALGEVDNAPQLKTRIEFFCGLAVFNDKTISKVAPKPAARTSK